MGENVYGEVDGNWKYFSVIIQFAFQARSGVSPVVVKPLLLKEVAMKMDEPDDFSAFHSIYRYTSEIEICTVCKPTSKLQERHLL